MDITALQGSEIFLKAAYGKGHKVIGRISPAFIPFFLKSFIAFLTIRADVP